jgi:hypothetical protein
MRERKVYLVVLALLEWAALVTQLTVHLETAPVETDEALIRFFSFFTILTNILIGIYVVALLPPRMMRDPFFTRPPVQTALVMYITVVGLIYNLILRGEWHSSGLQAVLHDILHTVIPLLVIIYWVVWVNARQVRYTSILLWLVYPAVYTLFVFIRASSNRWYPYPFMDLARLGGQAVLINCLWVLAVFLFFSLLYVFWGRRKGGAF